MTKSRVVRAVATSRMRPTWWLVLLVLLAAGTVGGGCAKSKHPPPEKATRPLILDDAHGGSNGLYFLPPMVPQPVLQGTFVGDLSPAVQIDELDGPGGAILREVATFTMSTGPGSETVRVGDDHYVVNWHTDEFGLDTQLVYRIRVLLAGRQLGFADVQPVATGGQMKNVDSSLYIPLVDGRTLPIKFWLNPCGPVVCTPMDQCHEAGTCDGNTGLCSNPAKADGSACDDGNLCTQADSCQAGACVGAEPVICTALDQCHDVGVCDPATGACNDPPKADGSACDDGNLCTQTDSCQAGACAGADPVVCTALDQCHDPGTCDPATGICSNPPTGDGTFCDDGDACTQADFCDAGACVGQEPVVCVAQDQCHDVGVCNSTTGECSNPAKADGAPCSDGDACTQTDGCMAGACVGANPVVCTALDQCHVPGVCDPGTGVCS
ncbi:MAG: hypothetical protein JXP73_01245, partial [Deltaproteobacteria bacterium]|nr:hypothetical protein [Deltaproteobacteria bacterium]